MIKSVRKLEILLKILDKKLVFSINKSNYTAIGVAKKDSGVILDKEDIEEHLACYKYLGDLSTDIPGVCYDDYIIFWSEKGQITLPIIYCLTTYIAIESMEKENIISVGGGITYSDSKKDIAKDHISDSNTEAKGAVEKRRFLNWKAKKDSKETASLVLKRKPKERKRKERRNKALVNIEENY